MSEFNIPVPKLPSVTLPSIRGLSNIPGVGCPGALGTTFVGEQFGNLPDLQVLAHIKSLKKAMEEQIYALIQGQLPFITRPPVYAARAAQLIAYVAQIIAALNQIVGGIIAEVNAAVGFIQQKRSELNSALSIVMAIPASTRTAAQRLMLQRYREYVGELDAQKMRLLSSISCLLS